MSAITETPAKRGPGRPRTINNEPTIGDLANTGSDIPVATELPLWYGLPIMPDEEMENYGGDLSALDSWSRKSGRPLATWRDAPPISRGMPDLSSRGLLVNRHAPEQCFHWAYLAEDGSQSYQQAVLTMRLRGYKPATLADWYVHSLLRDVLVPEDGTGRLTLGGALKGGAIVVYCQDEANYRRIKSLERAQSDRIQETAEQRQAEMQERLARDGFGSVVASASVTDGE